VNQKAKKKKKFGNVQSRLGFSVPQLFKQVSLGVEARQDA